MTKVVDNPDHQRFELELDGKLAFVNYRRSPGVIALAYAEVPLELRGGGVGAELVKGTLERVRERGEKVIPVCGFVASYMRRHADVYDLLAH
jgi:predicted GNAT family acetyltransferase